MTEPSKTALLRQLEAAAAVVTAARAFFASPSGQAAARADLERRQAALDFRALRPAVPAELRAASRALERLADQTGRCAEEAGRLGVGTDRRFRAIAARLSESLLALKAAAKAWPQPSCEAALVEAKSAAGEVERLYREARAGAWSDVKFIRGLKVESALKRLSEAGDAAQEAAEALACALGASAR